MFREAQKGVRETLLKKLVNQSRNCAVRRW